MKIAIISINAHTRSLNLACPIHSWAFQQYLLKHGIESTILNYEPNYTHSKTFNAREPYSHYVKACEKKQLELKKETDDEKRSRLSKEVEYCEMLRDGYKVLAAERMIRFDKKEAFVQKYLKMTPELYTTSSLEVSDPGFDLYICASDVIWKCPDPTGFDLGFLLASKCMDGKGKIAYAASRGVPIQLSDIEEHEFNHYLSDMDHISVREESLGEKVHDLTGVMPPVVLDPVLLHDAKVYDEITVTPKESHYVLIYYPEERTRSTAIAANRYAKEHGLSIVEISSLPLPGGLLNGEYDVPHTFRLDVGPDEWIGYIKYADYIFTSSFHAICFSILFRKQFSVGNRNGDKVDNILRMFDLEDRKLHHKPQPDNYDGADTCNNNVDHTLTGSEKDQSGINYGEVYAKLTTIRKSSEEYIINAIESVSTHGHANAVDYESWRRSLTYVVKYVTRNDDMAFDGFPVDGEILVHDKETTFKHPTMIVKNDGSNRLLKATPHLSGNEFLGWMIKVKIVDDWFYIMKNNGAISLVRSNKLPYRPKTPVPSQRALILYPARFVRYKYRIRRFSTEFLFAPGERIPYIPVSEIDSLVAEAYWKDKIE